MNKKIVTNQQTRDAVTKLLQVVHANSGVSPLIVRFLLSTHGVHSDVNFDLFAMLDRENLEAARIAMQYSIFDGRYELPLEQEEIDFLVKYWRHHVKTAV